MATGKLFCIRLTYEPHPGFVRLSSTRDRHMPLQLLQKLHPRVVKVRCLKLFQVRELSVIVFRSLTSAAVRWAQPYVVFTE